MFTLIASETIPELTLYVGDAGRIWLLGVPFLIFFEDLQALALLQYF